MDHVRCPSPSDHNLSPTAAARLPCIDYFGPGGVDKVLPIVCISYVWDTHEHPDPSGQQVRAHEAHLIPARMLPRFVLTVRVLQRFAPRSPGVGRGHSALRITAATHPPSAKSK
mmetsp:Transcript_3934/g.12218  ORF Transcript_3934/g.12218 Transcript_3934/m.12218 type:complete len:114 (+) Transcript_3934:2277-2618(+)